MLIALLPILLINMCNPPAQLSYGNGENVFGCKNDYSGKSRKLEHTNHIASAILKNVHAYILLMR